MEHTVAIQFPWCIPTWSYYDIEDDRRDIHKTEVKKDNGPDHVIGSSKLLSMQVNALNRELSATDDSCEGLLVPFRQCGREAST